MLVECARVGHVAGDGVVVVGYYTSFRCVREVQRFVVGRPADRVGDYERFFDGVA